MGSKELFIRSAVCVAVSTSVRGIFPSIRRFCSVLPAIKGALFTHQQAVTGLHIVSEVDCQHGVWLAALFPLEVTPWAKHSSLECYLFFGSEEMLISAHIGLYEKWMAPKKSG